MRTLEEMDVHIPDLATGSEWSKAASEVDAVAAPIVRLQGDLARLLKDANTTHRSSVLVPWLILWTRVFQGLEGLRGAVSRRSIYTIRILGRTLFETNVHLRAIARKLIDPDSPWPEEVGLKSTENRLHAYLTWCLWSDLKEWRQFLHPQNLRRVYDPRPARLHRKQFGDLIDGLPHILGEVETLTDAEAEIEREEHESLARTRIEKYEYWLSDDRLKHHLDRIHRDGIQNFLELIEADEESVLDALKAEGVRHAYSVYSRASSVIHGTTVENILTGPPDFFFPQIWSSDEALKSATNEALGWAGVGFLGLYLIRPERFAGEGDD